MSTFSGDLHIKEEMFSTLDKVDQILVKKSTGQRIVLLTDHRNISEIEDDLEVSLLFALSRVINANFLTLEDPVDPYLIYSSACQPPISFHRAVASAGGSLIVHRENHQLDLENDIIPFGGELEDPFETADRLFSDLAKKTAKNHDIALDRNGLETFQIKMQEMWGSVVGPTDETEYDYWKTVLELSCICGEVKRGHAQGRWSSPIGEPEAIPFNFVGVSDGIEVFTNIIGKSIKFLANGNEDSLITLLSR